MTPEEEQIWRGIKDKDSKIFEEYYKTNYRLFYLAACKYLQDPPLAEEIVNDIFIRLWEDAATLDIHTSLKFYIHRAVINRSLNQLDKTKREMMRREQFKHGLRDADDIQELEDDELKIRLYNAIDALPEQCQNVFKLSRFEHLKQQEIADRLGISIKTVKNHVTRALRDLNKVLVEYKGLPLWLLAFKFLFFALSLGPRTAFFVL